MLSALSIVDYCINVCQFYRRLKPKPRTCMFSLTLHPEVVMDLGHPVCCELLEQIMPDQKVILRKELVPVLDMVPDHEVVPDLDNALLPHPSYLHMY